MAEVIIVEVMHWLKWYEVTIVQVDVLTWFVAEVDDWVGVLLKWCNDNDWSDVLLKSVIEVIYCGSEALIEIIIVRVMQSLRSCIVEVIHSGDTWL